MTDLSVSPGRDPSPPATAAERARPPRLDRHNVAVVIPALNEALRIREVVEGALAQCAQVIVIDDGRVVGTGTHESLLADCPPYMEFADSQAVSR